MGSPMAPCHLTLIDQTQGDQNFEPLYIVNKPS